MTKLKEIRPELIVISGSPEDRSDGFRTDGGDYLWSRDRVEGPSKNEAIPVPIPIQLHYHPLEKAKPKQNEPQGDGRPVLLLHGASAGADTFLAPEHGKGCFVDYLLRENYEPWLLDWRASKEVAETIKRLSSDESNGKLNAVDPALLDQTPNSIKNDLEGYQERVFKRLNFNAAAEHDIKHALEVIRYFRPGQKIDLVAHCMGAAVTAEFLVRHAWENDPLSHVTLSTIGMFYEMNLQGRLKVDAHLIKRIQSDTDQEDKPRHFLDPRPIDQGKADSKEAPNPRPAMRDPWPDFIDDLYNVWRVPYDEARMEGEGIPERERLVFELFNRLSFMFGEPYQEGNLAPEIHHRLQGLNIRKLGENDVEPANTGSLIEIDGEPMGEIAYDWPGPDTPMLVYRCGKDFEPEQTVFADGRIVGQIDDVVSEENGRHGPLLPGLFGPMSLDLFRHGAQNLRAHIATIAQAEDDATGDVSSILSEVGEEKALTGFEQLEGVTLISGGLNRLWHRDSIDRMADWLRRSKGIRGKLRKKVFLDYGHQDLFWGRNAAEDVFPFIIEGLGSSSLERVKTSAKKLG